MEDTSILGQIFEWLITRGVAVAVVIALILFARKSIDVVIKRVIHRAVGADPKLSKVDEEKREDTLIGIFTTTAHVVIWVIGGIIILSELGVDVGPLIAGASIVGFALGYGAQNLVKDIIAGTFIIMENQYRVGDVVEIEDTSGVVEEITMRKTVLRDLDGNVHHVPNGAITVTTNMTITYSRVNVDIGVSYDADIDKVEKVINKVGEELANDEEYKDLFKDPLTFLRVDSFGDSSVNIKVLGEVEAGKQWAVAGEFRRRIKKAFDKEKIEIPFPQMVVHKPSSK